MTNMKLTSETVYDKKELRLFKKWVGISYKNIGDWAAEGVYIFDDLPVVSALFTCRKQDLCSSFFSYLATSSNSTTNLFLGNLEAKLGKEIPKNFRNAITIDRWTNTTLMVDFLFIIPIKFHKKWKNYVEMRQDDADYKQQVWEDYVNLCLRSSEK